MNELVAPSLPYDMKPRARAAAADVSLRQFVGGATRIRDEVRRSVMARDFGPDEHDVKRLAAAIRQAALDRLDELLERFVARAEAAGAVVHAAADAEAACAVAVEIARRSGAARCVKSKSMVTEEIGLVDAFAAAGVETVETDLGEFIVQIDGDAPSHIVAPMIHKDRTAAGRSFERVLGVPYTDVPETLTRIAREHMRGLYRRADIGVSGANFLLADEGAAVICTNEGNFDLSTGGVPVHVIVAGIEKLLPGARDLAPFLKLLARSGTGQKITVYTSFVRGPRRAADASGPREVHVILVDAGRTGILAGASRDLLRCIRCGACLNACPVYRTVGGHAYGSVYSGPIGAVLTPELDRGRGHDGGLANYPDLARASSLCGACGDACPVGIDLPGHLLRARASLRAAGLSPRAETRALRLWRRLAERPRLFRLALAATRMHARLLGTRDGDRAWLSRAPGPAAGWTATRDLPVAAGRSFRDWFAEHAARRRP